MDRWVSSAIQCQGGLVLNIDALTQGSQYPGTARVLQNYEPAIEGGYRRISGTIKYDSSVVPGDSNQPVTGVKVALGGVFAVRKTGTDNRIYFSSSSGWGSKLNASARTGTVDKSRWINYSISEAVVVLTDGQNYAWKYNGTTETTLNGAGAPTNPKYAALFRNRLVLAGYSANPSAISISAPNDDEDFTGASGAAEINVGDTIVGIKTFRDELFIFCERSIKRLTGSVLADFAIAEVAKSIGCISGDSIQEVGGDLIFLSADGFRSLAATERIGDFELSLLSKQIQPLVRAVLGQNFSIGNYSSCVIRRKSQYRIWVNDSAIDEDDNVGFIGKLDGRDTGLIYSWSTMRGIRPYCADCEYTNNQEIAVYGHPTNGYVYRMESGNTFDGRTINAIYRSPDITFTGIAQGVDATIRKVMQKLSVYTQAEGNIGFSVNLKFDRESTGIYQPDAIPFSQTGSVPVYGTAVYGTDSYGELAYPVFSTNLIGSGFTCAFVFTDSTGNAPHRIDSFQVQIGVKGRR